MHACMHPDSLARPRELQERHMQACGCSVARTSQNDERSSLCLVRKTTEWDASMLRCSGLTPGLPPQEMKRAVVTEDKDGRAQRGMLSSCS